MITFPIPLSEVIQGDVVIVVQFGKNLSVARCEMEKDGIVRCRFNGGYSWLRADEYGKTWECFK